MGQILAGGNAYESKNSGSSIINEFTGTFGQGKVQFFLTSSTFVVPSGVTSLRVRVFGAGGGGAITTSNVLSVGGGGGGGFSMKTITGISPGTSVPVTVGAGGLPGTSGNFGGNGGTSSFGAYCSATGGLGGKISTSPGTASGGTGSGGDINRTGGYSTMDYTGTASYRCMGGGGAASFFGNGGSVSMDSSAIITEPIMFGGSAPGANSSIGYGYPGLSSGGAIGGSYNPSSATGQSYVLAAPYSPQLISVFSSLDYLGTGGGGATSLSGGASRGSADGYNGGGGAGGHNSNGGLASSGGFPGGGGGGASNYTPGRGGAGLVVVEW